MNCTLISDSVVVRRRRWGHFHCSKVVWASPSILWKRRDLRPSAECVWVQRIMHALRLPENAE